MKTRLFIPYFLLFFLFCGFKPFDLEKVKVTEKEMETDRPVLDSCRMHPKRFYDKYFLYPKLREVARLSRVESDSMILSPGERRVPNPKIESRMDSVLRETLGAEGVVEMQAGAKRVERLNRFIKSKLTPERLEMIRQMRRLASDYSFLDSGRRIVVGISKKTAASKGISECAFDNFEKWVRDNNDLLPELKPDEDISEGTNYVRIYFDDNIDERSRDIIIRYLKIN